MRGILTQSRTPSIVILLPNHFQGDAFSSRTLFAECTGIGGQMNIPQDCRIHSESLVG
ncbi:hypothetical protein [Marinobacter halodurans]|uniref:hypothetical protein n=1 Tax=Marinobacter halodurans TaxID=2528979 RepID=UPI0013F172F2|nr:hypothetical protein [Marinobacter halodurans]